MVCFRFLKPLRDFSGWSRVTQGVEGVLVMVQLECPSNLAGRGQNSCLKNNLM